MNTAREGKAVAWGIAAVMGMLVLLGGAAPARAQPGGRGNWRGRGRGDWRSRLAEMRRRYDEYLKNRAAGTSTVPDPPKPEDAEETALFVKWSEGRDDGKAVLMLTISDAEGKETASLICPNGDEAKADEIRPDSAIADAAKTLKIGDEITVGYTFFKGRVTVRSVELAKALSADDRDPFTFVRVAEVRRGNGKFLGVTAKRNKLSWTFLIPNQEVSVATLTGPDGKPLGAGTMSVPAPRIVEALGKLRNGDLISLQYSPADYRFVLGDLSVSRIKATGKFERLSARMVGTKRHDMALFRVGTRSLSLVVPLPPADAPATNPAAAMSALLKTMRPWQAVDITYRRQDGISWLEEVTVKP